MLDPHAVTRDLPLGMSPIRFLLEHVASSLAAAGLDLFQAFSVARFNGTGPEPEHLPTFGRDDAPGVVVGNSAALWEPFLRYLQDSEAPPKGELGPDPLDAYVEMRVAASLERVRESLPSLRWEVSFAHQLVPRPIPIQRIADVADLARLGPAHLSIHSTYGPWIALRAVICFDLPTPRDLQSPVRHPATCDGCEAPCRVAFDAARAGRIHPVQPPSPASLSAEKSRWLAVRDVCPVGSRHRYQDAQILYHYDKRRDVLLAGGSSTEG